MLNPLYNIFFREKEKTVPPVETLEKQLDKTKNQANKSAEAMKKLNKILHSNHTEYKEFCSECYDEYFKDRIKENKKAQLKIGESYYVELTMPYGHAIARTHWKMKSNNDILKFKPGIDCEVSGIVILNQECTRRLTGVKMTQIHCYTDAEVTVHMSYY